MARLIWNDSYSVGVKALDEQHKKLFSLVGELHEAMLSGKGREKTGTILNEMVEYVQEHFSTEEKLMAKYNYPGLAEQQKEHAEFVKKVTEMQKKYQAGSLTLSIEINQFLGQWISEHINGVDKKYSTFFSGKGEK